MLTRFSMPNRTEPSTPVTDTIELVAGREMDAEVAVKIFGFTVRRGLVRLAYYEMEGEVLEVGDEPMEAFDHEEDYIVAELRVPPYSTSIAAAWTVMEHLVNTTKPDGDRDAWVRFCKALDMGYELLKHNAPNAALVICRAALAVTRS